ncbi:hypothetical protein LINGRAHAP2_LOCUS23341 [Linum grandiflorum]
MGNEGTCLFRYGRLQTFYFICGNIWGIRSSKCESRYRFPEDQFPFLWDDSIKDVSQEEMRAQAANHWLKVRDQPEKGR